LEIRKFYDVIAESLKEDYKKRHLNKRISVYHGQYKLLLHRLIDFFVKDFIVLDLGCGKAGDIISFSKRFRMGVGLDLSKVQLEMAKKRIKNYQNIYLTLGDAQHLPIKHDSVNLIICSEVLEHLPDPLKTIESTYFTLKDGGIILTSTPNANEIFISIGRKLPLKLRGLLGYFLGLSTKTCLESALRGTEFHLHVLNKPNELKNAFEKVGFKTRGIFFTELRIPFVNLFNKIPYLLNIWYLIDSRLSNFYSLENLFKRHLVAVFEKPKLGVRTGTRG